MQSYDHLWQLALPAVVSLIPGVIAFLRRQHALALALALGGPVLVVTLPYLALIGITLFALAASVDREVAVGLVRSLPAWPWCISAAFAILGTVTPVALTRHKSRNHD